MWGGQSGSRKERTDRVELLPRLLLSRPLPVPTTTDRRAGLPGSQGQYPIGDPTSAIQPQNQKGPGTWLQCAICM